MTTRRNRLPAALCAAVLALAAPRLFAADPPAVISPAPDASPQALSPAVQSAINDLASEDFKTRQAALTKLEVALGDQMRTLVASDDPETQSRLITLLEFNEGLSRWILDTYKLPNEQRKAAIDFGLQPDILPVLALVFSPDPQKRVEGAHALAKNDSPAASDLLVKLLNDPERPVYLAAMEAVWDRKPTQAIVDALWERAIQAGLTLSRGISAMPQEANLKFRGRNVPTTVLYDYSYQKRSQDSNIATDVLINIKAPQVNAKIKSFFEGYLKATDGSNPNANPWVYNGQAEHMKNALRLITAYKSKDTAGILLKIIAEPVTQRQQAQIGAEKIFWTNRTTALAALVISLDQSLEDYSLKRSAQMGGVWTSTSEADEEAAIKKIKEYCDKNLDAIGKSSAHKSDQKSPATKPAEAPEPAPDQPNAAPHHIILQGGGNIQIQGNIQVQIAPAPPAPPAKNDPTK